MQSLRLGTTVKWECWNTTDGEGPVVQTVASRTPSCVARSARSLVRRLLSLDWLPGRQHALQATAAHLVNRRTGRWAPFFFNDFDCPLYGFSITKRIVERSAPFPKNTYAYFEVQNANVLTPHH